MDSGGSSRVASPGMTVAPSSGAPSPVGIVTSLSLADAESIGYVQVVSLYQRLAQEYSKMKAQVGVLKKAVSEEQASVFGLRSIVQERDVKIRKMMEDIDKLEFHNQQLSKRVEVLQGDLDSKDSRSGSILGGGKKQAKLLQESLDVAAQELRAKIEENEGLHIRMYEQTKRDREKMETLEAQLAAAVNDMRVLREAHEKELAEKGLIAEGLVSEKQSLAAEVAQIRRECAGAREETIQQKKALGETIAELRNTIAQLSSRVSDRLSFDDSAQPSLAVYNVVHYDPDRMARSRELAKDGVSAMRAAVAAFSDFQTYLGHRLSMQSQSSRYNSTHARLAHIVSGHGDVVAEFDAALALVLGGGGGSGKASPDADDKAPLLLGSGVASPASLRALAAALGALVKHGSRVLPYAAVVLGTRSKAHARFYGAIEGCAAYAEAAYEAREDGRLLSSIVSRIAERLVVATSAAESLSAEFRNEFRVGSASASASVPDGTAVSPAQRQMETNNDCIATALASLASALARGSTVVKSIVAFLASGGGMAGASVGEDPARDSLIRTLDERARSFAASLRRAPCKSVPYTEAIANKNLIQSLSIGKESLLQQASESRDRLAFLETERERLLLDRELATQRLESEERKAAILQSEMEAMRERFREIVEDDADSKVRPITDEAPTDGSHNPVRASAEGSPSPFRDNIDALSTSASEGSMVSERTDAVPFDRRAQAAAALAASSPTASPAMGRSASRQGRAGITQPIDSVRADASARPSSPQRKSPDVDAMASPYGASAGDEDYGGDGVTRTRHLRVKVVAIDELSGVVVQGNQVPMSSDAASREALIKRHFTIRLAQLTSQLQLAESKAATFLSECRTLTQRIKGVDVERTRAEKECENLSREVSRLQDALVTTERNYESQMAVMADHIAGLNERLSAQRDRMDRHGMPANGKQGEAAGRTATPQKVAGGRR
eukprot:Opistho-2@10125